MKKQKICIIGDGLSGLITTLLLGKLDLQIDLISSKLKKKKDNRTTAISPSNHTFLSKNLFKKNSKLFFKCKKIKLIATDIDGVWTDSKMYYSENGVFMKSFSTYDGMGSHLLLKKEVMDSLN